MILGRCHAIRRCAAVPRRPSTLDRRPRLRGRIASVLKRIPPSHPFRDDASPSRFSILIIHGVGFSGSSGCSSGVAFAGFGEVFEARSGLASRCCETESSFVFLHFMAHQRLQLTYRFVAAVLALGIGCGPTKSSGGAAQNRAALKLLGLQYGQYLTEHRGSAPADEAAMRKYLELHMGELAGYGVKSADDLLPSLQALASQGKTRDYALPNSVF